MSVRLRNVISSLDAKSELLIGALFILLAHTCDVISTYMASPDLRDEANPLYRHAVSHGLGGWDFLILSKALGIVVSIVMFAYYIRQRGRFFPALANRSFHDFLHDVHGKDAVRRKDGSWVGPSPRLLAVWVSFTISVGGATWAAALTLNNLMIATAPELARIVLPIVVPLANLLSVGIFMLMAVLFWRAMYDTYRRTSDSH